VIAATAVAVCVGAAASRGAHATVAATRPPVTIKMGEFFFRPRHVTVHVGQAVRFVNVGKIDHTVADTDAHDNLRSKLIRPRALARGQQQVVRFAHRGEVFYLCTFHPTLMKGTITVVP